VYLLRGPAPWTRWILGAACVLIAARTYARNDDWRDEHTLWASAVQIAPASYKTHMAAAGGLSLQAAQVELDRALAILDPLPDARNVPIAYVNAGGLYRDMGDAAPPPNRAAWYRKSLETLLRAQRIQAAAGTVVWYQLYEELSETYRRLGDADQAALSLFQATLAAPANGALRATLADRLRAADENRVCALARALNPPQAALRDLGCPLP
jgi:tetratricopeptide (TPR) repeat protein